jgi:hypothetical protein
MEFEVELIVVDPIRIVDAERERDEFLPENGRCVQAALNEPENILVTHDTIGSGRLIVYVQARQMQMRSLTLQVKERSILCG